MSEQAAPYEAKRKLTNKQRIFIDEYLRSFNATRSAIASGYSEKTAYSIGQENLKKPDIKAEIDERLRQSQMSADEAMQRLADMARGDIGELIDNNGLLDIRVARDNNLTKLIRKIKQKTITRIGKTDNDDDIEITEIEFEMYSAQSALETILKAGGSLKDSEININVNLTDG
jgi:phage terminase small subunit